MFDGGYRRFLCPGGDQISELITQRSLVQIQPPQPFTGPRSPNSVPLPFNNISSVHVLRQHADGVDLPGKLRPGDSRRLRRQFGNVVRRLRNKSSDFFCRELQSVNVRL